MYSGNFAARGCTCRNAVQATSKRGPAQSSSSTGDSFDVLFRVQQRMASGTFAKRDRAGEKERRQARSPGTHCGDTFLRRMDRTAAFHCATTPMYTRWLWLFFLPLSLSFFRSVHPLFRELIDGCCCCCFVFLRPRPVEDVPRGFLLRKCNSAAEPSRAIVNRRCYCLFPRTLSIAFKFIAFIVIWCWNSFAAPGQTLPPSASLGELYHPGIM